MLAINNEYTVPPLKACAAFAYTHIQISIERIIRVVEQRIF